MKLYIYRGLDNEEVPKDTTHVIIDNGVTVIKKEAFDKCIHLESVIMGDHVKRIGAWAFGCCYVLRFIRLSKMLEYIGNRAFWFCKSLEALSLPSTLKEIRDEAFVGCSSLRLLILQNLSYVGETIIHKTSIERIAENAGVAYEWDYDFESYFTDESDSRVNEWLKHHMDEKPFHKLCYSTSITTKRINNYLAEYGDASALAIDPYHGMTPLHMLSMNPHAPADTIAALLDINLKVAFFMDREGKMSLDYARDYNVGGLVGMINGLCNHRHAAV